MVQHKNVRWTYWMAVVGLVACGNPDEELGIETSTLPIPPAGSDATFQSHNIPTEMAPGERLNVRVVMRNSGTNGASNDWNTTNYVLHRISTVWSWVSDPVTPPVPACGAGPCTAANDGVFDFVITAPAANPSASFTARMRLIGDQYFGQQFTLSNIDVNPANQRRWSCELVSSDIPATMAPSETRTVNVTVRNNGSGTWQGTNVCLFSRDSTLGLPPANYNKWGAASTCVPTTNPVAPNDTFTFTFPITAPATLGPHTIVRQISDRNPVGLNGGVGLFDNNVGCLDQTVNVDNAQTPVYAATVLAQDIPLALDVGEVAQFRVTMLNSGTATWSGSAIALRTVNTPFNLWTQTISALGGAESVLPGQSREFVFTVTAPATPGLYSSEWRMIQNPGIGLFGDTATTNNIVVSQGDCSNGITQGNEQCDDGNVVNGDGCTSACVIEPRSINLANSAADRGELGPQTGKQYTNVQIGDLTGDGAPEVVMQGSLHVYPPNVGGRSLAGEADIFAGTGFFTGANETAPGTAAVRIWGAGTNDASGGSRDTSAIIGDVTGDGIGDLIFTSRAADGVMNARTDSGELWVIAGAADLLTAGAIDLGANPLSTRVVAHIVGAAAGDNILALGVADLTGDGDNDLLIGMPGRDGPNGVDAGGLAVLPGPLTGEIDLSTAILASVIDGPVAGLRIGTVSAVGDISRDGVSDFIFGVRSFDNGGFNDRGVVCAFFGGGVLPASVNLLNDPCHVTWLGDGAFVGYGTSVAIGNVIGTGDNEVVIGGNQLRKAGVQVGGVDVWDVQFFQGLFFDLSGGPPTIRILGDNPGDEGGKVLALGDMNGDGYADIPFVASSADGPLNDQDGNGEVRIVLGGNSLTGNVDMTVAPITVAMYGAAPRDLMGAFPRGIAFGDIDNDGRSDFCIGSHQGGSVGPILVPGRVDCVRSRW